MCVDEGPEGAHCAWTNDGPSTNIDKPAWDVQRFGYFCMSDQAYEANQIFMEQACELTKGCRIEKLRDKYQDFILKLNIGKGLANDAAQKGFSK